jgi:hypothetical protein
MNMLAEYLEMLKGIRSGEARVISIVNEYTKHVCSKDFEAAISATDEHERSGRFAVHYSVYCNGMESTVIVTPIAFSFRTPANPVKSSRGAKDHLKFSLAWLLRALGEVETRYYSNEEDAAAEIVAAIRALLEPVCSPEVSIDRRSHDAAVIRVKCMGYTFKVEAYRDTKMEVYGATDSIHEEE